MPYDFKNQSDALEAVDQMLGLAKQNFDTDGYLAQVALLFTPKAPGLLVVGPNESGGEVDKDKFSATIRDLAKKHQALGVLHVSEAWILVTSFVDKTEMPQLNVRVSQHPDRKEAVVGRFEHLTGVWQYVALIDRTGIPTLKPFTRTEHSDGTSFGRFTGFLAQHRPIMH